ncbi:histidine kinase [Streptosporangium soli]|nr:histidine kinase [Streptosporangium sp. KLBMP 9127]
MARLALAAAVVIADTTLLWLAGTEGWALAAYALLTTLVMVLVSRAPFLAFLVTVPMALFSGASLALLACTSYQAGRRRPVGLEAALTIGAAVVYLGMLLLISHRSAIPPEPWIVLARGVVLVALPMMAGRYLAQQGEHLRRERELTAERERLRERLRIARDMHDSLGHALSLVSVQAAALEVAPLPADQRQTVRNLASAARAAVDELHEVVGTLRRDDSPGLEGIEQLVAEFRRAGVPVRIERSGVAGRLGGAAAAHASYRVVQEGLTNAAKHAPGSPVTVSLDWQPDALLVAVGNAAGPARTTARRFDDERVPPTRTTPAGHGLTGLSERVRSAGGLLRVHPHPHTFRLVAMFPVTRGAVEEAA